MNSKSALLISALLLAGGVSQAAPLGTAFTYQGRLDQNGQPSTGAFLMRFSLWDALTLGNELAGMPTNTIPVTNGLFQVSLDFGASHFLGQERWLQVEVWPNNVLVPTLLQPRTRLAPAPNALYATAAGIAGSVSNRVIQAPALATIGAPPAAGQVLTFDGSGLAWQGVAAVSGAWSVNGNNAAPGQFLGTTGNQPLDVRVNNARGLRLEPNTTSPNLIGGWNGNLADAGVSGATIGGGGAAVQFSQSASNRVTDHFGTVGGGAHNLAGNTNGNLADAYFATVGGGHFNLALGVATTIAGGAENVAANNNSSIGGGYLNSASGYISTISGGQGNRVTDSYGVVGGGFQNSALVNGDTVGGGYFNIARGSSSAVGGGYQNLASGGASTVAGGSHNQATNSAATVAGGENNNAAAEYSAILGGYSNVASGYGAAVGGGNNNVASGLFSSVPGGLNNIASGDSSYALGATAQALHTGSFVWADSQSTPPPLPTGIPFSSIANDEFAVRARGGARFQTQFLEVSGQGSERAYLGGDGVGGEVHVGSLNANVSNVAFYNMGSRKYMHVQICGLTIMGGCDLAEPFPMKEEKIDKGSVVVIDEEYPGRLKLSTRAYDTQVAGIISGANGINPGIALKQQGVMDQGENVALTGRVYVKAEASQRAIKPGDLLTTSDTPGHAMKVSDHGKAQGAILGKAMTALAEGKGLVLVLVTLQ